MEKDEKANKTPKRDRYWSIMLVGDHGRVIPFRHFKSLVVGGCLALTFSLAALIVLGIMYGNQRQTIGMLKKDLKETRDQVAKFRDEKDLYLTQLMALKQQNGELSRKPDTDVAVAKEAVQTTSESDKDKVVEEIKKEEPVKKSPPKVKWSADIRNFKATYDNRNRTLTAQFRIYNTSTPKKTLSGRTVVVFKKQEDSPIHWTAVPAVVLHDGKPLGDNGKTFKINNYRTEHFTTIRKNDMAAFDMASIFIFTRQGELIANQEIAFNVDYSPPKPATPVESVPDKSPGKKSETGEIRPKEKGGQPDAKTTEPAPQIQNGSSSVKQPSATPAVPAVEPEENKPEDSGNGHGDMLEPQDAIDEPVPENTESTTSTPAAEPKPALEGGQK